MDERSIAEIYKTIIDQNSQQLLKLGKMEGQIEAVLAQTIKTNGRVTESERRIGEMADTKSRVTELESKVDSLRSWRWYLTGGAAAVVVLYEIFKPR